MADPAAAPSPDAWTEGLNKLAEHYGLAAAVASLALLLFIWRAPKIILAVGTVVNDWRQTSLDIAKFRRDKGTSDHKVGDDVRSSHERLHKRARTEALRKPEED